MRSAQRLDAANEPLEAHGRNGDRSRSEVSTVDQAVGFTQDARALLASLPHDLQRQAGASREGGRFCFCYDTFMRDSNVMSVGIPAMAVLVGLLSGCGVVDVRDDANAAVDAWTLQTGETDPCRIDAMQHCIGASATAASVGPPLALLLGQLLELQQGDGDPMDLHNNEAGAGCAMPITDEPGGAVDCCEALLNAAPPLLRTDGRCD